MDEKRIRRMPLPLCLDNPLHMEALKIIEAMAICAPYGLEYGWYF